MELGHRDLELLVGPADARLADTHELGRAQRVEEHIGGGQRLLKSRVHEGRVGLDLARLGGLELGATAEAGEQVHARAERGTDASVGIVARGELPGDRVDPRSPLGKELAGRRACRQGWEEGAPGIPALSRRGADPGLGLDHARLRPLGQPDRVGQSHDSNLGPERGRGEDGQEHDRRHAVHAIPRSGSDWEDSRGGVLRQIRRKVPPSHRQDRENGAGTPTGREVRPTTALECRPGYRGLSLP